MLLCEADQILDFQLIPIIQNHVSLVSTKMLLNLAKYEPPFIGFTRCKIHDIDKNIGRPRSTMVAEKKWWGVKMA